MFNARWFGPLSGRVFILTVFLFWLVVSPLSGAGISAVDRTMFLSRGECPRVADPKLADGGVPFSFTLRQDQKDLEYGITVVVTRGPLLVRRLVNERLPGSRKPVIYRWDGRDEAGRYAAPGEYLIRVTADREGARQWLEYRVNIIRLGITAIEALPDAGDDEWQMVYFRKGSQYAFYATPAIHEYHNIAENGEVSDLDLNNGEPRPAAPVHTTTDSPVLDGSSYETRCYNYPVCYLKESRPRFRVTMGSGCTSAAGEPAGCGYPLAGIQIRGLAGDQAGFWESGATAVRPGGQYLFEGPPLPDAACRTDRTISWRWQYRELGDGTWVDIPGSQVTEHRFYTIVDQPYWPAGASGTQYAGPWVEVADYLCRSGDILKIDLVDEARTLKAFIRGYFGQEGPLDTAIEGVVYDCYSMGGDGGATHYYSFYSEYIQLSRLLNNHANGIFVNCSDVSSSSAVMLGMLGVQNVRMLYLGSMDLRAIWGIGCPDYTLNLWGSSHGFSYHHIITRDNGTHVSDACMWLDEDGNPDALPGVPGYNTDRVWDGSDGYNALSATNNVSKTLDTLPDIH